MSQIVDIDIGLPEHAVQSTLQAGCDRSVDVAGDPATSGHDDAPSIVGKSDPVKKKHESNLQVLDDDLQKLHKHLAEEASIAKHAVGLMFRNTEAQIMDVTEWMSVLGIWSQVALNFILEFVISSALGFAGIGFIHIYTHVFKMAEENVVLIFAVVGSIFTGWHVAQYASFTIQTTGHQTLRGHLMAIREMGLYLLLSNLGGWCLCFFCFYVVPHWNVVFHVLLIATPAIVAGIFFKTFCKLKYIRNRVSQGFKTKVDQDALSFKKLRLDSMCQESSCPFAQVLVPIVLKEAAGPLTCFLWTVVYALALRALLLLVFKLPGGREGWQQVLCQIGIFILSKVVYFIGAEKLKQKIAGEKGIMSYSNKMCVAFYFIYATVTNSLMRLSIVAAQGNLRVAFSILQPVSVCFFRVRPLKNVRPLFDKARTLRQDAKKGKSLALYAATDTQCARMTCSIMGALITSNVVSISFSGMSCIFSDNPGMGLKLGGKCPTGLLWQIVKDAWPTWTMNFIECIILTLFLGMPCLYYFVMLDPFIVVCTLVVIYVNLSLILLTASISF